MSDPFADRISAYRERVGAYLDAAIPAASRSPEILHEAMRYAVLGGGKRIRPLLVYASGECLGVTSDMLDAPAAAIELIHAFSLVHDDLPAMDDDDLRRGLPTVHRKFDEATAILAGDALLPLAFGILAAATQIAEDHKARLIRLIASASGSLGMTGGQAIDLASEGKRLSVQELEHMHRLKTAALIRAAVLSGGCLCQELPQDRQRALDTYGWSIGLAFQIRDDLLDVEGVTHTIGKTAGSDADRRKATWPALFGRDDARRHCDDLLDTARDSLQIFGATAEPLLWLADYVVERAH